jgi:hypothetical protein
MNGAFFNPHPPAPPLPAVAEAKGEKKSDTLSRLWLLLSPLRLARFERPDGEGMSEGQG